jgi:SAM-dependent methyltransferase
MEFYQSIAKLYDYIFPLNPEQINFVRSCIPDTGNAKVLDVGCGSGSLCLAMAPVFKKVVGIDPDQSMLYLARKKAGTQFSNLQFLPYGMLGLENKFQKESFDAILCFGNTLVHLGSEAEILAFLTQARALLRQKGKLFLQIIHYDRIIDQDIKGLPTIENEQIKFVRNYHFHAEDNSLDFETILTDKKSSKDIRNVIPLHPIRKDALKYLLIKAGFSHIAFYGNFKKDHLLDSSVPLIIEAFG